MKAGDVISIVFLFCLGVVGLLFSVSGPQGQTAEIIAPDGVYRFSLTMPRDVTVQGKLGAVVIRITNGRAGIITSPCPNQICVHRGFIGLEGESSLCVPGSVILRISGGESKYDAVTQ